MTPSTIRRPAKDLLGINVGSKPRIAVFPFTPTPEPCVCIYGDATPVDLTPEQALELASFLIQAADIVASTETA